MLFYRIRLRLFGYTCRCGARVLRKYRQAHEDFHVAIHDFCQPPTSEEMAEARKVVARRSVSEGKE